MEEKNIGVVEYFNAESDNENCGFIKIKFTSQSEYLEKYGKRSLRVYINRSQLEKQAISFQKGDIVCFDIIEEVPVQYYHAENIREAEVEDLTEETLISDIKNYQTVKKLLENSGSVEFSKFLTAIINKKNYLSNCEWVHKDFLPVYEKCDPVQQWNFLESRIEGLQNEQVLHLFDIFITNSSSFLSNLLTLKTPIIVKRLSLPKATTDKLSYCVANSKNKIQCAKFLLNNLELFKAIDVADEISIFMMYAVAKENKISAKLLDIPADKNQSPRVQIVYCYLCAGFYKARGEIDKMHESISKAAQIFVDIFTINFDNPENFPELHHVLPGVSATNLMKSTNCRFLQKILYCESKKWDAPQKDESGKYLRDENGELIRETVIFCPRLRNHPENPPECAHLYPNLNLPINEWSLIELVKKLELDTYEEHFKDGEFFNYIGASFNRLWELRERLKCRVCGEYMKPAKPVKFRKVTNIGDLTNPFKHHAVFGVTVFQCKDKNCSEYDKGVYLSYCWHCHEIIDSRDTPVKLFNPKTISNPKTYNATENKFVESFDGKPAPFYSDKDKFGYYSCTHCGAGYRDYKDYAKSIFDETSEIKYEVFPGTLCPKCTKCPKCGCQELSIIRADSGFKLKCNSCGEEFFAKMMNPDSKSKRKFICADENCKHAVSLKRDEEVVIKSELKSGYSPIPWAKEISIQKNPESLPLTKEIPAKKNFEEKTRFDSYYEWEAYQSRKSD